MYTYKYPRPALTVDSIVFTKDRNTTCVLLIQRGQEPFKNKWALPGGFVNIDELLKTACRRELEEETGLKVEQMEQFKAFDAIDRDPRHRTISVVFSVELPEKQEVKGGDDAAHAKWFQLSELPELAFDHQQILEEFFS
ncbi:MAG: NUDIX domain-containing protein [Tangfeifania sp.]